MLLTYTRSNNIQSFAEQLQRAVFNGTVEFRVEPGDMTRYTGFILTDHEGTLWVIMTGPSLIRLRYEHDYQDKVNEFTLAVARDIWLMASGQPRLHYNWETARPCGL